MEEWEQFKQIQRKFQVFLKKPLWLTIHKVRLHKICFCATDFLWHIKYWRQTLIMKTAEVFFFLKQSSNLKSSRDLLGAKVVSCVQESRLRHALKSLSIDRDLHVWLLNPCSQNQCFYIYIYKYIHIHTYI